MRALALVLAVAAAGCSFAPSDKVMEQLAKDPATWCIRTHVIYGIGNGTVTYYRTGIVNGTVQCGDEKMTVTSGKTAEKLGP